MTPSNQEATPGMEVLEKLRQHAKVLSECVDLAATISAVDLPSAFNPLLIFVGARKAVGASIEVPVKFIA